MHEGALRASLRATYGIDLRDPGMSPAELAELVLWLPPGSPLWISVGGPLAWPADVAVLHEIEFRLRVLDWRKTRGAQPKRTPPPAYAHERASKDASIRRKAEAYQRRQRKREG